MQKVTANRSGCMQRTCQMQVLAAVTRAHSRDDQVPPRRLRPVTTKQLLLPVATTIITTTSDHYHNDYYQ